MGRTVSDEHCPVTWCDQGSRIHRQHESTLGTWFGTVPADAGSATVQLVIYGSGEHDVRPVIGIVGPRVVLPQLNAELSWEQLTELMGAVSLAIAKYAPQGT